MATPFFVLSDVGPQYESIFPLPSPEILATLESHQILPTLKSHVNPFFVIANAGQKLASSLALVPEVILNNPDIFTDIALLRTLWDVWTRTPPDTWKGVKYISRRSGNNRGGGGNNGRGAVPDGRGPERRSTRSSSSRHDGSPTPSQGSNRGAGRTVARREACLPDLEPDDCSDGVDSDVLTKDAVRLVPYLDRRFFVQNWLDGKPVHSDEDQVQRVNS
jgi:hypothetical protein